MSLTNTSYTCYLRLVWLMVPTGVDSWIKLGTPKSNAMHAFCSKIVSWKRNCGLDGYKEEYDPILGCYGNPNAETVFLAEIPSLRGMAIGLEAYKNVGAWRSNWKVSDSDLMFRVALHEGDFIKEDPVNDEPWTWDCWITDFVKCGASTLQWNRIKREGTNSEIMKESADLLKKELDILRPKRIVFVGGPAKSHFNKHYKPRYGSLPWDEVKHYSYRGKTVQNIEEYYEEFRNLRKKIKAGRLG